MSLSVGDTDCTTGLSGRIYGYLTSDARNGFSSPMSSAQSDAVKALCYAVAHAVVYELQTNAVVQVTADTDDLGAGVPASPVVLGGSIT